ATVGEALPVRATVFREGHDAVSATAVLIDPDGVEHSRVTMTAVDPGLDHMEAWVVPDREGDWTFRVEGWSDPYATWLHDAPIKIEAGVAVELMLAKGAEILEAATAQPEVPASAHPVLRDAVTGLRDQSRPAPARLAAGTAPEVQELLAATPVRDAVTPSPTYRLRVDRTRSLFSSWYEFFPRSEGAHFDAA